MKIKSFLRASLILSFLFGVTNSNALIMKYSSSSSNRATTFYNQAITNSTKVSFALSKMFENDCRTPKQGSLQFIITTKDVSPLKINLDANAPPVPDPFRGPILITPNTLQLISADPLKQKQTAFVAIDNSSVPSCGTVTITVSTS